MDDDRAAGPDWTAFARLIAHSDDEIEIPSLKGIQVL